jgi:hypothetical protein
MFDQAFVDHFWSFVDTVDADGCWPCYRQSFAIVVNGKKLHLLSHRIAYQLTYGAIEPGLVVRHLCTMGAAHTPMCANPKHLRIGTQQENMWDYQVRRQYIFEPGELGGYEDVPEWIPPPFRKKAP